MGLHFSASTQSHRFSYEVGFGYMVRFDKGCGVKPPTYKGVGGRGKVPLFGIGT